MCCTHASLQELCSRQFGIGKSDLPSQLVNPAVARTCQLRSDNLQTPNHSVQIHAGT